MTWLADWLESNVTKLRDLHEQHMVDQAVYHSDDCRVCQEQGALRCPESRRLWALVHELRQGPRYPGEER